MERIIRKILNYDTSFASDSQRDELVADVTALSMFLLDKTNHFEVPSKLNIDASNSMQGGDYGNNLMRLSKWIFTNNNSFFNDLSILAHEVCHFAQEHSVDSKNKFVSGRGLNCAPEHFEPLIFYIICLEKPNLIPIVQQIGVSAVSCMDQDVKKLNRFFDSFYGLQSFEVEADNFSIEMLKFIVKTANNMKLSDKEKRGLYSLEEKMEQLSVFYDKREEFFNLRQDPKFVRKVRESSVRVVEYFLRNTEFRRCLNKSNVDINPDSELCMALDISCQFLEINYDEGFAKKVLDMLFKAKPSVYRDRYIFEIFSWTPIELSKEQEDLFKQILKETAININVLTFEEIVAEKNRVLKERDSIMRGNRNIGRVFNLE